MWLQKFDTMRMKLGFVKKNSVWDRSFIKFLSVRVVVLKKINYTQWKVNYAWVHAGTRKHHRIFATFSLRNLDVRIFVDKICTKQLFNTQDNSFRISPATKEALKRSLNILRRTKVIEFHVDIALKK